MDSFFLGEKISICKDGTWRTFTIVAKGTGSDVMEKLPPVSKIRRGENCLLCTTKTCVRACPGCIQRKVSPPGQLNCDTLGHCCKACVREYIYPRQKDLQEQENFKNTFEKNFLPSIEAEIDEWKIVSNLFARVKRDGIKLGKAYEEYLSENREQYPNLSLSDDSFELSEDKYALYDGATNNKRKENEIWEIKNYNSLYFGDSFFDGLSRRYFDDFVVRKSDLDDPKNIEKYNVMIADTSIADGKSWVWDLEEAEKITCDDAVAISEMQSRCLGVNIQLSKFQGNKYFTPRFIKKSDGTYKLYNVWSKKGEIYIYDKNIFNIKVIVLLHDGEYVYDLTKDKDLVGVEEKVDAEITGKVKKLYTLKPPATYPIFSYCYGNSLAKYVSVPIEKFQKIDHEPEGKSGDA